jgi:transposase
MAGHAERVFVIKFRWASRLYRKGKTPSEIAEIIQLSESTVRSFIDIVKNADENHSEKNG